MTVPKALQPAFENTPWIIPELAPKDKPFIGVFEGYPYPAQAHWNAASNKWVHVMLCVGLLNSEWNDHYFENVWSEKDDLIARIPMEEWK